MATLLMGATQQTTENFQNLREYERSNQTSEILETLAEIDHFLGGDYLQEILISFYQKLEFFHTGLLKGVNLYLIFNLYIFLALGVLKIPFNILIYFVNKIVTNTYIKNRRNWVNRPKSLIRLFKAYYTWQKIYITFGDAQFKSNAYTLYRFLTKPSILSLVRNLGVALVRPSIRTIFSLVITILIYYQIPLVTLLNYLQNISFTDLIKSIPALVVLIVLIISLYYVGPRGNFERAIGQVNKKILEQIVEIHRKLIHVLAELVFVGISNIEQAIIQRESIIDYWIMTIFPMANQSIQIKNNLFKPIFKEIEGISKIIKVLKDAEDKDVLHDFFWLWLHHDLTNIREIEFIGSLEGLEKKLNRILFTPEGYKQLIELKPLGSIAIPENEEEQERFQKEVEYQRNMFKLRMDETISDGIETIVRLYYYEKAAFRLMNFNSGKFGRWLRFIAGKE